MKAVLCVPTITKPYRCLLDSIEASIPEMERNGIEHYMVSEVGCPYISAARATMLRKALDIKPDAIIFLDHDLSFDSTALSKLILTEGDYVTGTYRFKKDDEEYMGQLLSFDDGRPMVRKSDGAIKTYCSPAGFMKITPTAVNKLIKRFPELCYGDRHTPHFDLFNHGAHDHVWYGEDYACSRRWLEIGESIWTVPDLDIDHHGDKIYKGNLHKFLLRKYGESHDISNAQAARA